MDNHYRLKRINAMSHSTITFSLFKTIEEMFSIYPFIHSLNHDMTEEVFKITLERMLKNGYQCVGAYDSDHTLIGICGFWINYQFYSRHHVQPDNLVVDKACRHGGVGKELLEWVEGYGKKHGCVMSVLDTYVDNDQSHRFYFREGYKIRGFHFTKDL
jgi:GNAT superfamily N-acetyltransferase